MGHMLDTSEQRTANIEQAGEQMPMPVRFDAQKGSRSEVLPDALGRSSKQREPPRKPAQENYGAERGGGTEREASGISSAALRPLCARSLLLPRPPPFIAQEGAVRHSNPTYRI